MPNYVPVPVSRLLVGRVLPVDIWTPDGRLLLRRGQALQSDAHRDLLTTHQASMTEADAQAWYKSLERAMRTLRQDGTDMHRLLHVPMPDAILEVDYLEGRAVTGGWLDLQETLRSLLYQGAQATAPLARLDGIEQTALALLHSDPDECLFVLFQALPDLSLGYCATHALLCGVVCVLAAAKLRQPEHDQALLMRSALIMNIGMARPQDHLARQTNAPDPAQRQIIADHPPASADILRGFGVEDEPFLNLVHWHHDPEHAQLAPQAVDQIRLLNLSDALVAKMAPRSSRLAMTAMGAAKLLVLQTTPDTQSLRSAMASVLGFYPPGTYVQLCNGEVAVVIQRGARANTPHVASILNAAGMPLGVYLYRDCSDPAHAITQPLAAGVKVHVSLDKVRRLRQQRGL